MKILNYFAVAALAVAAFVSTPHSAKAEVSVDFFYSNLEPHGDWLETDDYGYVWQPASVGPDWQPYTDGHWVFTDVGWTWVSEEPHGWATYHYGRWTELEESGWVWVPDVEWAPAWVSWRRSDTYVGWAPLPPESIGRVSVSVGISGWADAYFDIGPRHYRFVETRSFGAQQLRPVFVDQSRNVTIINETTNITNITYNNNVVYNGGPEYEVMARQSAEPIRKLKLNRRGDVQEGDAKLQSTVQGDELMVVAPQVQGDLAQAAPQKVARKIGKAKARRGWENAGDEAEVKAARQKMKAQANKAPKELPQNPKFERRASRKQKQQENQAQQNAAAGEPPAATEPEAAATAAGGDPVAPVEEKAEGRGNKKARQNQKAAAGTTAPAAATGKKKDLQKREQQTAAPAGAAAATTEALQPQRNKRERQERQQAAAGADQEKARNNKKKQDAQQPDAAGEGRKKKQRDEAGLQERRRQRQQQQQQQPAAADRDDREKQRQDRARKQQQPQQPDQQQNAQRKKKQQGGQLQQQQNAPQVNQRKQQSAQVPPNQRPGGGGNGKKKKATAAEAAAAEEEQERKKKKRQTE